MTNNIFNQFFAVAILLSAPCIAQDRQIDWQADLEFLAAELPKRHVDLFANPSQADFEADRYTPNMWLVDQDLKAMRQHLTDDFLDEFKSGRKAYLQGDWALAIDKLNNANEIMLEMAVEAGYLIDPSTDAVPHEEELAEHGDGPTLFLLNYMKSKGGVAPDDWEGWHPLTSK